MRDYPLIIFVIAFSIGLILTSFLTISFTNLLILLGVFILLSLIFFFVPKDISKTMSSFLIFISIAIVGMISITASQLDEPEYPFEKLFIRDILIDGRIEEIELPSDKLTLKVSVERTFKNDTTVTEKYNVLCNLNYDEETIEQILNRLRPGNRVVMLGNLQIPHNQRNPGEFDYREYLRGNDIAVVFTSFNPMDFVIVDYNEDFISSFVFGVRYAVAKQIKKIYTDKTAGLLKGLLLADRSEIGYDIKEGFINSGVIHVLAVSGLHVGFIVLILLFLLGRFNIYLRIAFTIFGLIAFMIITGMPPSVTRATIMAVLLLISYLRSNKQNNFNTLALAVFIILIFEPTQIFNPGFQLSFSAVISIFVFFPRLKNFIDAKLKVHRYSKNVLLFVAVSLAAQLGTLPFTAYYFGKFSLISLFANLVIIPLIGFVVGLGIFTLILNVISPILVLPFILTNEFLVEIIFGFVKVASSFRFAYLSLPNYSICDGAVYLVLLSIFTMYFRKIIFNRTKFLFIILLAANLLVWSKVDNKNLLPDGKLSILFLDVGHSESALIKFSDNKTAIINFGNATTNYSVGKTTIFPLLNQLGIDKIDYGMISHLNRNKYLGILELIEKNMLDTLLIPKVYGTDKEADLFNKYLSEQNIVLKLVNRNKIKTNDSRIYMLTPILNSEYNYFNIFNKSAPLIILHGNTKIFFPGGIEKRGEEVLIDSYGDFLKSDLMQIANFGSDVSTSEKFYKLVSPKFSVISVGLGNYMEYPDEDVVRIIESNESQLLRIDEDGAVLFISDGQNIDRVNWRLN